MQYKTPEWELVEIPDEDIITSSPLNSGGNPDTQIPGNWGN